MLQAPGWELWPFFVRCDRPSRAAVSVAADAAPLGRAARTAAWCMLYHGAQQGSFVCEVTLHAYIYILVCLGRALLNFCRRLAQRQHRPCESNAVRCAWVQSPGLQFFLSMLFSDAFDAARTRRPAGDCLTA